MLITWFASALVAGFTGSATVVYFSTGERQLAKKHLVVFLIALGFLVMSGYYLFTTIHEQYNEKDIRIAIQPCNRLDSIRLCAMHEDEQRENQAG